jgi:hypothetical protein
MRKVIFTLALLSIIGLSAFAQALIPTTWLAWATEPADSTPVGYVNHPYTKEVYVASVTPEGWVYDAFSMDFDAAWNSVAGDAEPISKLSNEANTPGNLFDGTTFGGFFKAAYDTNYVYLLLKYLDTDGQTDEGSRAFEIALQPVYYDRYEPDFIAAGSDVALQNNAYARYIELGGGKAVFSSAGVTDYSSSVGGPAGTGSRWATNEIGSLGLIAVDHFWSDEAGIIKAIFVIDIKEVLSYALDPLGDISNPENRAYLDIMNTPKNDTIAFEIKTNALVSTAKLEYWWGSHDNDSYCSLFYNGYMIFEQPALDAVSKVTSSYIEVYVSNDVLRFKGVERTNVKIFSVNGQLVKSANNVSEMNVGNLTNGVYFVRLDNSPKTFKVAIF